MSLERSIKKPRAFCWAPVGGWNGEEGVDDDVRGRDVVDGKFREESAPPNEVAWLSPFHDCFAVPVVPDVQCNRVYYLSSLVVWVVG